jgi:hypothetical protein
MTPVFSSILNAGLRYHQGVLTCKDSICFDAGYSNSVSCPESLIFPGGLKINKALKVNLCDLLIESHVGRDNGDSMGSGRL